MKTESIPMAQLAELLAVQLEVGVAPLRVTGSSMYPTFRNGRDTVILKKPDTSLRKGDVILYLRDNGQYVLHRIVGREADMLILSGDNQYEPELLRPDQVIARVVAFHRGKKFITDRHRGYRLWVWFWVGVFPLRRPMLALRHWLGNIRRKLTRKKRKNALKNCSGGTNYE